MASAAESITCAGFVFFNNFDSANLARVEPVRIPETFEKGNALPPLDVRMASRIQIDPAYLYINDNVIKLEDTFVFLID